MSIAQLASTITDELLQRLDVDMGEGEGEEEEEEDHADGDAAEEGGDGGVEASVPFFRYTELVTARKLVSSARAANSSPTVDTDPTAIVFDQFCSANTFQGIMGSFQELCDLCEVKPVEHVVFYKLLKERVNSWKAQSLWTRLDKRAAHREYRQGKACTNSRVLVIGGGPCGLRTAIEVALMGGKAVVLEKRDRFSRNNVLHLWPLVIHDLKALGAKKFFGKFCAGAIDHVSIRTLQCILLKAALLVGVEVHPGCSFEGLESPNDPADASTTQRHGWRTKVSPADHPVSEYEFDVLIGADGKRNTLGGFKRKEFRGKLAIAITANFINRHSQAEASVEEISGVAYIFNQKFFNDLNAQTGIDLENIVYYKDETHYFVMTAKKHSLLYKGVLIQDEDDPAKLLAKENVDQEALLSYAREAADVSTRHQLPDLDFAHNHYGQPDVAMFDFTSMFAAEHASRVVEKHGKRLLMALVGDSLMEPFWPTGSGCARGFLGALDAAWMIRSWASGKQTPLDVMAERESIYQLLSQTTPENINKNFHSYTLDPNTRYPNLNFAFFKPHQVRHQYDGADVNQVVEQSEEVAQRYEWLRDSHNLLKWFQRQLEPYRSMVRVLDLTASWRSGLALSALIHKYRPELLDVYALDQTKVVENNQLAFDLAEKEFGIPAVLSGQEMFALEATDKAIMVSYLSQFYEYFRKESIRPAKIARTPRVFTVAERVPHLEESKVSSKRTSLSRITTKVRQRRQRPSTDSDSHVASRPSPKPLWSSSEEEFSYYLDEFEGRGRKPITSSGLARKRAKEMEPDEHSIMLQGFSKLEEPQATQEPKYMRIRREMRALRAGVRGQNKVSVMAKDLATKFKGDEKQKASPPASKKLDPKPLILGEAEGGEKCYFCRQRVYLMERQTAEGLGFHRGCLRCDYCATNLRLGSYAFENTEEGGKFYCVQHNGMKKPYRRPRKRSFGEKDVRAGAMGLVPATSPRRTEGGCQVDGRVPALAQRTPERVEYVTESEQEESELDQTQHNLSSSLFPPSAMAGSSSDSSDTSTDEDLSDSDFERLAWSYNRQMRKGARPTAKRRPKRPAGEADDDVDSDGTETGTIGASDADWEMEDTETEKESDDGDTDSLFGAGKPFLIKQNRRLNRRSKPEPVTVEPKDWRQELTLSPTSLTKFSYTSAVMSPPPVVKETKPSPTSMAINRNRMAFFDVVSEPVRIDANSFLGLRPPGLPVPRLPGERTSEEDGDGSKAAEDESTPRASADERGHSTAGQTSEDLEAGAGGSGVSGDGGEPSEAAAAAAAAREARRRKKRGKRRLTGEVETSVIASLQGQVPVVTVQLDSSGAEGVDWGEGELRDESDEGEVRSEGEEGEVRSEGEEGQVRSEGEEGELRDEGDGGLSEGEGEGDEEGTASSTSELSGDSEISSGLSPLDVAAQAPGTLSSEEALGHPCHTQSSEDSPRHTHQTLSPEVRRAEVADDSVRASTLGSEDTADKTAAVATTSGESMEEEDTNNAQADEQSCLDALVGTTPDERRPDTEGGTTVEGHVAADVTPEAPSGEIGVIVPPLPEPRAKSESGSDGSSPGANPEQAAGCDPRETGLAEGRTPDSDDNVWNELMMVAGHQETVRGGHSVPVAVAEDIDDASTSPESEARDAPPQQTLPCETVPGVVAPLEAAPQKAAPEEAASQEAAPQEAAPQEAAPQEAAPQEAAPQEAAPQETSTLKAATLEAAPLEIKPQEAAPQEAAPQEAAPQEAAPEEAMFQEASPQEASPLEASPQEAAPQEAAPQEAMSQEASPQKASPQEASPQEASPQEAAPQEAAPQEAMSQEASPQEASPLEAAPQEAALQEASPQESSLLEAAPQEAAPQEAAPQVAAPQEAAPQEAAPQEAAPQVAAPQEAATQEPAPQEASPQEASPQEVAPLEAAPQEAAPKETAPQQAAHQEPAPQEPALEEAMSQEASPQEAAPLEAAPQEAAPQETAPQQATHQEPALQEAAPQEAAPQEVAPQQAAHQEPAPQEAMSQEASPQEAAPQEAAPQEAAPQEAAPQEAASLEAAPQGAAPLEVKLKAREEREEPRRSLDEDRSVLDEDLDALVTDNLAAEFDDTRALIAIEDAQDTSMSFGVLGNQPTLAVAESLSPDSSWETGTQSVNSTEAGSRSNESLTETGGKLPADVEAGSQAVGFKPDAESDSHETSKSQSDDVTTASENQTAEAGNQSADDFGEVQELLAHVQTTVDAIRKSSAADAETLETADRAVQQIEAAVQGACAFPGDRAPDARPAQTRSQPADDVRADAICPSPGGGADDLLNLTAIAEHNRLDETNVEDISAVVRDNALGLDIAEDVDIGHLVIAAAVTRTPPTAPAPSAPVATPSATPSTVPTPAPRSAHKKSKKTTKDKVETTKKAKISPIAKSTPATKSSSSKKSAAAANRDPATKSEPATKSTPAAKSSPASKSSSITKSTPATESYASTKSAAAAKSAAATKSEPATKSTPAAKSSPASKSAPALNSTPATKSSTATKSTPAAKSFPAPRALPSRPNPKSALYHEKSKSLDKSARLMPVQEYHIVKPVPYRSPESRTPKLERSASSPGQCFNTSTPVGGSAPALGGPHGGGLAASSPGKDKAAVQQEAMQRIDDLLSSLGEITEQDADGLSDRPDSRMETEEEDDYRDEFDASQLLVFSIDDDLTGTSKSISLNEKFVNTRDRRRRKESERNNSSSLKRSFSESTADYVSRGLSELLADNAATAAAAAAIAQDESLSLSKLLLAQPALDESLSLDNLVEANGVGANAAQAKPNGGAPNRKVPSLDITAAQNFSKGHVGPVSNGVDCSSGDSTPVIPMDMSGADDSVYFTPEQNPDQLSPDPRHKMASLSAQSSPRARHSDAITVSSGGTMSDDQRSMQSHHSESQMSPANSLKDAKFRFFGEAPQPLRIDPTEIFSNVPLTSQVKAKESQGVKNGWQQAVDGGSATSPTAGVPHRDGASGEADDVFYTPATSFKTRGAEGVIAAESSTPKDGQFKTAEEVRKRILPTVPQGKSATLGSGQGNVKPSKRDGAAGGGRPGTLSGAFKRPMSAKAAIATAVSDSTLSPAEGQAGHSRSDSGSGNVGKGKRKERAKSAKDEDKENKDSGEKKEKRRSLLSLFTKSSDKKDKSRSKSPAPPKNASKSPAPSKNAAKTPTPPKNAAKTPATSKAPVASKSPSTSKSPATAKNSATESKSPPVVAKETKGGKSRALSTEDQAQAATRSKTADEKRSSLDRRRAEVKLRGGRSSGGGARGGVPARLGDNDGDGAAQRQSMYEEFAPLVEDMQVGQHKCKETLQERLQQVAPPPAKAPHTALSPPRAEMEDFDTEGEFTDDRLSVRSFQAITQDMSEEEVSKALKKQQKAVVRRQKEHELKRLRLAQEIQRHLEEVEIKQRQVEEKGVSIEMALRGESVGAQPDEATLMQEWFNVVREKNVLVRYESELMVHARELELEDRQGRLEHQLRELMTLEEHDKTDEKKEEEQKVLQELVEVVEQRDALVSLLEEDRVREKEQDQGLRHVIESKGFQLSPIANLDPLHLPGAGYSS